MRIDQFVSNFSFGDAVSNNVRYIKKELNKRGIKSDIFTQYRDQYSEKECKIYTEFSDKNAVIIMHSSTYSDIHNFLEKLNNKKILFYHNITPSKFFIGFNDFFVTHLEKARNQLKNLYKIYDFAVSVSEFNIQELKEIGFKKVFKVPLFIDFNKLKYTNFDNEILNKYNTNEDKLFFLGRFAPNKKQDDIIKTFYIYNKYFNQNSRLILAGDYKGQENYYSKILSLIKHLSLENFVDIYGKISNETMCSLYKKSNLFFSMSEHEGFFVPVMEAYFFNIPVFAYDFGAVKETMNNGGILFNNKDFIVLSEEIFKILNDKIYLKEILNKQKSSLSKFVSECNDFKLYQIILENI